MIKIYDTSTETYITLEAYLSALESVDKVNNVTIQIIQSTDDIFELVKKETAYRVRFMVDKDGISMNHLIMTDDERDFFLDKLEDGARDVYQKLLAWAKHIYNSFQFLTESVGVNVTSGIIASYLTETGTDDDGVLQAISFTSPVLTPGDYDGMTLEIYDESPTSESESIHEFPIITNSKDSIFIDNSEHEIVGYAELIDYSFIVLNPYPAIYYYLQICEDAKYDLLKSIDKMIQDALVLSVIKEWYSINRMEKDFAIEEFKYTKKLEDIRSQMLHVNAKIRRKGFFDQEDNTVVQLT